LEQGRENLEYADWLLKIGDGQNSPDGKVHFPKSMKCTPNTVQGLIDALYPNIQIPGIPGDQYFLERTILAPKNEDVHAINAEVLNHLPGERRTYRSADRAELEGEEENNIYTQEFLHGLNASGLPLHNLELKEGAPIMLLRNLSPAEGLCNGTRLVITHCAWHFIKARVLGGDHAGYEALIPRIDLSPSQNEFSFKFFRRQLPVQLAFAMSINKAQGQSVKHIGIDLRTPVFTHGQLYVALSRSTAVARVKVLFPSNEPVSENIVYSEVL
jgi:ATP-dependent DNA helicase PIF1